MDFDPANWRKSRRSGGSGNQCVEVNLTPHGVGVRDSKSNGLGAVLVFTAAEWSAFVCDIRIGEFDLPS